MYESGQYEFIGQTAESILDRYVFRRLPHLEQVNGISEVWEWIDKRSTYIDHNPCWVTGEPQTVVVWDRNCVYLRGFI